MTNLKALRAAHGLTQEEAAQLAGLSYKHYQAIESGRKPNLWLNTVDKIAIGFQTESANLIGKCVPGIESVIPKPPSSRVHNRTRS